MPWFSLAPLSLELLYLSKPTRAVEAAFNPSLLPWSATGRDFNSDTAFLGDEVSSPPFQNRNLVLLPGIHLHWQVPRELTRSKLTRSKGDPTGHRMEGIHPQLPNRWLITRTIPDQGQWPNWTRSRWIVESDFLHPLSGPIPPGATAYPNSDKGGKEESVQAFRYLGRTLSLENWLEVGNKGEYLADGLTVMGYGNPAFAAFASDCRGIFTFHDKEANDTRAAKYSVVGFYNDSVNPPSFATNIIQSDEDPFPDSRPGILYIGKTEFSPESLANADPSSAFFQEETTRKRRLDARRGQVLSQLGEKPESDANLATHIAIGHTATEALCAFLADSFLAENKDNPLSDKSSIEEQLEAILMAADLEHRLQDHYPKFLEGRHAKGFTAFHGGMRWLIKPEARETKPPVVNSKTVEPGEATPTIPAECLALLDSLNAFQKKLEKHEHTRRTLVDRLSSDWHKYMLCAYPPPSSRDIFPEADKVVHLIKSTTMKEIKKIDEKIEQVQEKRDEIVDRIQDILSLQVDRKTDVNILRLKSIPGSRFWSPSNPVVVLAAPSEIEGYLPSAASRVNHDDSTSRPKIELLLVPDPVFFEMFENEIVQKFDNDNTETFQREHHDHPARPIYVEWSAQLRSPEADFSHYEDHFDTHYLSSRFAPAAGSPDLTPLAASDSTHVIDGGPDEESAYAGRSLITVNAAQLLHERLWAFLKQQFLKQQVSSDASHLDETNEQEVIERLSQAETEDQSLTRTALWAWGFLERTKILCLPLGGFNDALLMRRQTVQLPIAEPIGFKEYQHFASDLRAIVGELPTHTPVPLARFHPIRVGELQLDRLRIIDSFGRAFDITLAKKNVIAAEPLRGDAGHVVFPPRFLQPLRVEFRWLSGGHEAVESNSHPNTTPICGWLLPNRLDESIAVYDADGKGIGTIDVDGLWRPAPGEEHPIVPRDIGNPFLRRVILHILERGETEEFLKTINDALEEIDPDSFAAHPALSLLIGRPIAVVRASVQFELLGQPAEDHSWELLRAQVEGKTVQRSRRFEDVEIPFRIGEHQMLNDGVVGYWVEDSSGGFKDGQFHTPQTAIVNEDSPEAAGLVLKQAASAPALTFTLLMDPRGSAHLTGGVLPVKEIRLAENHFAAALKKLSVTFLATPLLMLEDRTEITLPGEPGYAWSFLDRTPQGWRTTPAEEITPPELNAAFRAGLTLREGWLRLEPKDEVRVDRPTSQTAQPTNIP